MQCDMNMALWHKDGNELLRDMVWQVNSVQFPYDLSLYLSPSRLFFYVFLLTVRRCSSSELCVHVSASVHLPEENKLTLNCSEADCNSKTHKEILLLFLL